MLIIPLIRCLPKMSLSSSTSTGSQIATWNRSLAWTRHDSTPISDYRRRERCSSDHWRFSLNPARHDILPHRQSQLSDLTIRLHITTSLKSISLSLFKSKRAKKATYNITETVTYHLMVVSTNSTVSSISQQGHVTNRSLSSLVKIASSWCPLW